MKEIYFPKSLYREAFLTTLKDFDYVLDTFWETRHPEVLQLFKELASGMERSVRHPRVFRKGFHQLSPKVTDLFTYGASACCVWEVNDCALWHEDIDVPYIENIVKWGSVSLEDTIRNLIIRPTERKLSQKIVHLSAFPGSVWTQEDTSTLNDVLGKVMKNGSFQVMLPGHYTVWLMNDPLKGKSLAYCDPSKNEFNLMRFENERI